MAEQQITSTAPKISACQDCVMLSAFSPFVGLRGSAGEHGMCDSKRARAHGHTSRGAMKATLGNSSCSIFDILIYLARLSTSEVSGGPVARTFAVAKQRELAKESRLLRTNSRLRSPQW